MTIGAAGVVEQGAHEGDRGRHEPVPLGPVERQRAGAVFEDRGRDERRQIGGAVRTQIGEQDDIQVRDFGPCLGEAQRRAAADVHQHARLALDPDQIPARGAPAVQLRPARPQHLDVHALGVAGRRGGGGSQPQEREHGDCYFHRVGPFRHIRVQRWMEAARRRGRRA